MVKLRKKTSGTIMQNTSFHIFKGYPLAWNNYLFCHVTSCDGIHIFTYNHSENNILHYVVVANIILL